MFKPTIKILGKYYGENQVHKTWVEKIILVEKVLNYCKTRHLTWYGKLQVLHSLAMTQITFSARIQKIEPEYVKKLTSLFFQFMWHPEVIEAIKRSTLTADKQDGGFEMIDVTAKIKACQVEKFKILKDLSNLQEFWHYEAHYSLGTKMKIVNSDIFSTFIFSNSL